MTKKILIDAIIGSGLGSYPYNDISYFVKQGLVTYTGNQWNASWEWNREELKKLTVYLLQKIYNREIEIPVAKEKFFTGPTKSIADYWSDTLDELLFKELTKDLKHDNTTV